MKKGEASTTVPIDSANDPPTQFFTAGLEPKLDTINKFSIPYAKVIHKNQCTNLSPNFLCNAIPIAAASCKADSGNHINEVI